MKIRNGFVTNSSSTSFIISMKEELTETNFLSAVGAEGNSPLNKIFEDLFNAIRNCAEDIKDVMKAENEQSVDSFLGGSFSKETIAQVKSFLEEGRVVYYGRLRSDGESAVEQYFCCESFILIEDNIYFNGTIGGW